VITDLSGNGRHGVYTGVDLGQPGIGDGRTCPLWDGVNDYGNVYSAGLAGAFNTSEGTLALWLRAASAGVWTDATTRNIARFAVSVSNEVRIQREATNGVVSVRYTGGGTNKQVNISSLSGTGWYHVALSWSIAANELRGYLGGVQQGATQTGLGAWVGALTSTTTILGAFSTLPQFVWSGSIAHAALWSTPLSAADVARLATL
jgi:hypothetical protein